MDRMRPLLIALSALFLLGCGDTRTEASVGNRVLHWDQIRDNIPYEDMQVESGIVLADKAQWDAWSATLPDSMTTWHQSGLDAVQLGDAVAVVVSYWQCAYTSELRHAGDGALEHRLIEEELTACEVEWQVVEVWQVQLEDLGVDADQVVLLQG